MTAVSMPIHPSYSLEIPYLMEVNCMQEFEFDTTAQILINLFKMKSVQCDKFGQGDKPSSRSSKQRKNCGSMA